MSGTHKLVVPGRRMWALRLPADDLAKFFAAARACGVSKTQFIRYLILSYYDEHVLPAIVDESRKRGITVNDLLGEILTTMHLEPDEPERNRCGSCQRCLTACPTQAITAPFELDARRCISDLTIELRGTIPLPFRSAIGNRIFGCDDCLAACPWNRFARYCSRRCS